ncbi:MAG: rhomboid family intramembrane serine protease, partial [Limisphaerales bacterium]
MWMILIFINVGCFLLQMILSSTFVFNYLALSPQGIARGFVWQFLTFQFLHGGLFHLFMNMFFGMYMFGRYVEERLGSTTFLKFYLLGGFAGGVLQVLLGFLFPQQYGGGTIGASAGTAA